MSTPSLLDAIRVVKENEKTATQNYAEAAKKIDNPLGKTLFEELSKFEAYHYEQLTALEKSLAASGEFINYQGREFPQPPVLEVKAAKDPNSKSEMAIILRRSTSKKRRKKPMQTWRAQQQISAGTTCLPNSRRKNTSTFACSRMPIGPSPISVNGNITDLNSSFYKKFLLFLLIPLLQAIVLPAGFFIY